MPGKDKFTPAERSAIMSRVHSWNTTPERIVRSTLHRLGYRYRLHDARLPGKPDLSFPSRRVAVFVHGCFWHRHPNCKRASTPVTRQRYWLQKFERTTARDVRNRHELQQRGWTVLIIWECQLKDAGWVPDVEQALTLPKTIVDPQIRSVGK
jgi:DNA mismatch endonuclease (patch repair protein)